MNKYIIFLNAENIKLTDQPWEQIIYHYHHKQMRLSKKRKAKSLPFFPW